MKKFLLIFLLLPVLVFSQEELPLNNSLSFQIGTGMVTFFDRPGFSISAEYNRKTKKSGFFIFNFSSFRSAEQFGMVRRYISQSIDIDGKIPPLTIITNKQYFPLIPASDHEEYTNDSGGAKNLEPSTFKYFTAQFKLGYGINLLKNNPKSDFNVSAGLMIGHTDTQFSAQFWPGYFGLTPTSPDPTYVVIFVPTYIRYNHAGYFFSIEYIRQLKNNAFWGTSIGFTHNLPSKDIIIGIPQLKFGVNF